MIAPLKFRSLCTVTTFFVVTASLGLAAESWTHVPLTETFYSEGAAIGDVDKDGTNDLVYGPHVYFGPTYTRTTEVYPANAFDINGYSDNFFTHLYDMDGDGWQDVLVIGFPAKPARWYRNPGTAGGTWQVFTAISDVSNESPLWTDLTGDGKPEIVAIHNGRYAWSGPDWEKPLEPWSVHYISTRGGGAYTHGLGTADIDGDGRRDVLVKEGWFKQPESLSGDPEWSFHEVPFAPHRGGAQMLGADVDGDGDCDVVTSLDAHGWGLVWLEQQREGDTISFVTHIIMGDPDNGPKPDGLMFSQMHGMELHDVNGDGLNDIVTGKRFWAHQGKDPDARGTPLMVWFELQRKDGSVSWKPHMISAKTGIGCSITGADINADGKIDFVVGNKKGAKVLIAE
ncbi:MAG: VCBS repeat-containing protein [Verrucomicrobia bacterium]|nr:VCBS repeat-containing protein [Verrucomicrobiota bacterium]